MRAACAWLQLKQQALVAAEAAEAAGGGGCAEDGASSPARQGRALQQVADRDEAGGAGGGCAEDPQVGERELPLRMGRATLVDCPTGRGSGGELHKCWLPRLRVASRSAARGTGSK